MRVLREPLGEEGDAFVSEYGGVAQLGEHLLCKQGVIGSIPFISTRAVTGQAWSRESESWKQLKRPRNRLGRGRQDKEAPGATSSEAALMAEASMP